MRPGRLPRKIFDSALISAWGVAYFVLFFGLRFKLDGSGMWPIPTFENQEAHYAEVERSRAQQASPVIVEVAARPQDPAPAAPVEKAAPKVASVYWTDFRGKARDGHYDQTPMALWPPKGLPQVWRQPIGGGYASFVIANGRAYTIEQRRRQEVVAAYDMATGREVWAHAWNAEF